VNKKGKPVRDLVRNEAEAAIKAQLYHMIVDEGFGGNHIVNWLNERGIKAKCDAALWRATSLWAMIGNPIDRGQMHLEEALSDPIDELRIIDAYCYYKAIEIIEERGKFNAERREGRGCPGGSGDQSACRRIPAGFGNHQLAHTETKGRHEAARAEYQRILLVNQDEEEILEAKRLQARKLAERGQLFEDAPETQKRMVLAEGLNRIEAWRGYQIMIKFKLTAWQFLEPDADGGADKKAS
jgi:hypothetical protein